VSRDGSFRIVELNLTTPNWPAALARAAADGLPLDVRLVVGDDAAPLTEAARALAGHDVLAVTPFDSFLHVTDEPTLTRARAVLRSTGIDAPVRGGSRSHFTELNRESDRIPRDSAGIVLTTTPLFHSLDTEQLVEALPMQRLIASQAVERASGLPVHIGPVSLRPRFNNVATSPEAAPSRTDLSEGYGAEFTGSWDDRQGAPELAAWTVASAAALAVPGVLSLAWFETWGPRGLRDALGGPRPAADAVAALVALHGRGLLWGASPDGLLWAIGGRGEDGDVILVANLDRRVRRCSVSTPGRQLDAIDVDAGAWRSLAGAASS
jgi:hypothetical protein